MKSYENFALQALDGAVMASPTLAAQAG